MPDRPTDARKPPSLDETIAESAVILSDQIHTAAALAKSEMDLQIEVAGALKEFARKAKISLEGHHNVTIATGRPDSVYGSVIVEYKDPGFLSPNKDAAPNKAVIDQLKRRFTDMNREEHRNWNSMFGVGTDGKYFIFLRFLRDKWTDWEPAQVDRRSTERFLRALYNLGQKGKPYLPEYLHGDFGAGSEIAQVGVRALYGEIIATDNPKAGVFFNQWKILFGEVCGFDVEVTTDKLTRLAEAYVVTGKPRSAQLLFALHTYYALLLKLISLEVVYFYQFKNLPRHFERLVEASTSDKLQKTLEELELRGGIFHQLGITNFLEGDIFSWYLAVWTEPIETLVRRMVEKLDEYNPGTISEDPAQSRDLLKKLYQQLFPKSVRQDLGEYYTPDWLAEHVLTEVGYQGDPDERLLDPACGSGTFLVMAINRIRGWYDENREKCPYDEAGLLERIQKNVVGFDLNPLAVMAARTNYILAVRDLLPKVGHFDIPVFLCDSILTPREYGKLFDARGNVMAGLKEAKEIKRTSVGPILVPSEVVRDRDLIGRYSELLHDAIARKDSFDDFTSACKVEGIPTDSMAVHKLLYSQLCLLDAQKKDRIWARIIRNSFAPIFEGVFDYVVGNPPWVNWDRLPADYRDDSKDLWFETGLFSLSGKEGRLGGAKKDISTLMLYVAVDSYLKRGGKLGFLITQTIFKTKGAGDGFRRFRYGTSGPKMHVARVDDFADFNPFEDASNWSSAVFIERDKETVPPVPYYLWELKEGVSPTDIVAEKYRRQLSVRVEEAWPVDRRAPTSPWMTARKGVGASIQNAIGKADYSAHAGAYSGGTNAVYWVEIIREVSPKEVLIRNLLEKSKKRVDVIERTVEKDLLYPLVRWRDVARWSAAPSCYIVLAQDAEEQTGIEEKTFRRQFRKTYDYLSYFKELLVERAAYKRYCHGTPFYTMYDIGPYTLGEHKVIWRRMDAEMSAAVGGEVQDKFLGAKVCVPQETCVFVECRSDDEAHYLCSLLNSAVVDFIAQSYNVRGGKGFGSPNLLQFAKIPKFSSANALHQELVTLSRDCHKFARENDAKRLHSTESTIDRRAVKLWGITDGALKAIQEALAETSRPKKLVEEQTGEDE